MAKMILKVTGPQNQFTKVGDMAKWNDGFNGDLPGQTVVQYSSLPSMPWFHGDESHGTVR